PQRSAKKSKDDRSGQGFSSAVTTGPGKGANEAGGLEAAKSGYRALQGKRRFICRDRFCRDVTHYPSLGLSYLRPPQWRSNRRGRNDVLGLACGESCKAHL